MRWRPCGWCCRGGGSLVRRRLASQMSQNTRRKTASPSTQEQLPHWTKRWTRAQRTRVTEKTSLSWSWCERPIIMLFEGAWLMGDAGTLKKKDSPYLLIIMMYHEQGDELLFERPLVFHVLFKYEGKTVPDSLLLSLQLDKQEEPLHPSNFLEVHGEHELVRYYSGRVALRFAVELPSRGWIHARAKFGAASEVSMRAPVQFSIGELNLHVTIMSPFRVAFADFALVNFHPQVQLVLYSFLLKGEESFMAALAAYEACECEPEEPKRLNSVLESVQVEHPALLGSQLSLREHKSFLERVAVSDVVERLGKMDQVFPYYVKTLMNLIELIKFEGFQLLIRTDQNIVSTIINFHPLFLAKVPFFRSLEEDVLATVLKNVTLPVSTFLSNLFLERKAIDGSLVRFAKYTQRMLKGPVNNRDQKDIAGFLDELGLVSFQKVWKNEELEFFSSEEAADPVVRNIAEYSRTFSQQFRKFLVSSYEHPTAQSIAVFSRIIPRRTAIEAFLQTKVNYDLLISRFTSTVQHFELQAMRTLFTEVLLKKYREDKAMASFNSHLHSFRKCLGEQEVAAFLNHYLLQDTGENLAVTASVLRVLLDLRTIEETVKFHEKYWTEYSPQFQELFIENILLKKQARSLSGERILNRILGIQQGEVRPGSLLAMLITGLGVEFSLDELKALLLANPFDVFTADFFLKTTHFPALTASLGTILASLSQEILEQRILCKEVGQLMRHEPARFNKFLSFVDHARPGHAEFLKVLFQRLLDYERKSQSLNQFFQSYGAFQFVTLKKAEFNRIKSQTWDEKAVKEAAIPDEFGPYLQLCSKINPLSHLAFFKHFNLLEGVVSEQQFIARVSENFQLLRKEFRSITLASSNSSISVFTVKQYFGNILEGNFAEEVGPLLKVQGCRLEDTALLRSTVRSLNLCEVLNNLSNSLQELTKIIPIEASLLEKAKEYQDLVEKVVSETGPGTLAVELNRASDALVRELGACGVRSVERGNEQLRLIQELSMFRELQSLFRKDIQDRSQFAEFKDYVNDQDESFINTKIIRDNELLWLFDREVVSTCTGLGDLLARAEEGAFRATFNEKDQFDPLSECLRECITAKHHLDSLIKSLKNKEASFRVQICEFMQGFEVTLKGGCELSVTYSNAKGVLTFDLKKVNQFRDKVLLIVNSYSQEESDKEGEVRTMRKFVQLVNVLNATAEVHAELVHLGYFEDCVDPAQLSVKISHADIAPQERLLEQAVLCKDRWKAALQDNYFNSYIFAHFHGKLLKTLGAQIFLYEGVLTPTLRRLCFWGEIQPAALQQELDRRLPEIKLARQKEPLERLALIRKVLQSLEPESEHRLERSKVRGEEVKLLMVKPKSVFAALMEELLASRESNYRLAQVLFCHILTSKAEVEAFLHMAMSNPCGLAFAVMGLQNLDSQLQSFFCETFDRLYEKRGDLVRLNLSLITSSYNEKIYYHFANHKKCRYKIITRACDEKRVALDMVAIARTYVYSAVYAGSGKTHQILKKCKEMKREPLFFPLAGTVGTGRVVQRLSQSEFTNKALVLQLHHVVDTKVLDEVLIKLVVFRALASDEDVFVLQAGVPVFIQLQNQLTQNYENELLTMRLLSQSTTKLKEARSKFFESPRDNLKVQFALNYMLELNSQVILKKELKLQTFRQEFEARPESRAVSDRCSQELLEQYFFQPLKPFLPSFTQLMCFFDLFYESLLAFCNPSTVFSHAIFNEIYKHLYPSKKKEMEEIVRLKTLNTLIENARDFVARSVDMEGGSFRDKLAQVPLLIMRSGIREDDYSFSFIFDKNEKVPIHLKKIIYSQHSLDRRQSTRELNMNTPDEVYEARFGSMNLALEHATPAQLYEKLADVAGVLQRDIRPDDNYALTLDNFYKMCLIIQRIRARVPIVIMGETGVGKTSLIRFLAENVYSDAFFPVNVHAGYNERVLQDKVAELLALSEKHKRVWVFFDEFNTTEEVGLISEMVVERSFEGRRLPENLVMLAACNPYRLKEEKELRLREVGIEKYSQRKKGDGLLYKVLPPASSMVEVMWNYQDLTERETLAYTRTILDIDYKREDVARVVDYTHKELKERLEKSAVSLRDVARFKILYGWFMANMPAVRGTRRTQFVNPNYGLDRRERAFILALCFCYYLRLPNADYRASYLRQVEQMLGYEEGHIGRVFYNEQMDYLTRMELPEGTALNQALRENVFAAFVCIMNKIPIVIVGKPGCSKSLSIRLLATNFRGSNSYEEFFRQLSELSIYQFQGSESCTSEGVERIFEKAKRDLKLANVIPTILFDEIGLAQMSVHNPLKVLHAHLQVNRAEVAFIGISNWELDAAKMGRFMVVARSQPDEKELIDTAEKIAESIVGNESCQKLVSVVSRAYWKFMAEWDQTNEARLKDFFGLRDFYYLIKYVSAEFKRLGLTNAERDRAKTAELLRRGVERNFDGREGSIRMFLAHLNGLFTNREFQDATATNSLALIRDNLRATNSRSLLIITQGDSMIYLMPKTLGLEGRSLVLLYGSTFSEDEESEEYNIRVLSDVINHIESGNVIVFKDVNQPIQTSLYDVFNKSYQRIGGKNYCRVAIGANYNPKCLVHDGFNSIVYLNEETLPSIEAAFLNRFEKHFLTIDKFLSPEQHSALALLAHWLDMLTREYLSRGVLSLANLFLNSGQQALASLCIRVASELQDSNPQAIFSRAKELLIRNSTPDFAHMLDLHPPGSEEDAAELGRLLEAKAGLTLEEELAASPQGLILFTFQKNADRIQVVDEHKCSLNQFKSERDLLGEIKGFIGGPRSKLHVVLDFETEVRHFSLVMSILHNKSEELARLGKKTLLTLQLSRSFCEDPSRLREVSFLNGFNQVFMESFKESERKLQGANSFKEAVLRDVISLKELLPQTVMTCLSRFDFKVTDRDDKVNSSFIRCRNSCHQQPRVIALIERFIRAKLERRPLLAYTSQLINPTCNFKKELLGNKEVLLMCADSESAVRFLLLNTIEEYATLFFKQVVDQQAFLSVIPNAAFEVAKHYVVGFQDWLATVREHDEAFLDEIIFRSLDLSSDVKASKSYNSIDAPIETARLLPFSKLDDNLTLNLSKSKDLDNMPRLCLLLLENDQKVEDSAEADLEFRERLMEFEQLFVRKTVLNRFDHEGNPVYEFLPRLLEPRNYPIRDLYLYDVRTQFLEQVVKHPVRLNLFLDRLVRLFLPAEFQVQQYLLVLLMGETMWKHLLAICNLMIKDHAQVLDSVLFRSHYPAEARRGSFTELSHRFIRDVFEDMERVFLPSRASIRTFGGVSSYAKLISNIYPSLFNLSHETTGGKVQLRVRFSLWRQLSDMLTEIKLDHHEEYELFEPIFAGIPGLFQRLDDYLHTRKKSVASEDFRRRMTSFQAQVVLEQWLMHRQPEEEDEIMRRIIDYVENIKGFAESSSTLVFQLFPCEFDFTKTLDAMAALNRLQQRINDFIDHDNVCSMLLADFFERCTIAHKPERVEEGESQRTATILQSLPLLKKIKAEFKSYNNIQKLYGFGVIKNVMKLYVEAVMDCTKDRQPLASPAFSAVEELLSAKDELFTNVGVYVLKLLRKKTGSFKRLNDFLFEPQVLRWVDQFKYEFEDLPSRIFFVPYNITSNEEALRLRALWDALRDKDFPEAEFLSLFRVKEEEGVYELLNIFMVNCFVKQLNSYRIGILVDLLGRLKDRIAEAVSPLVYQMLHCYTNGAVGALRIEDSTSNETINSYLVILNVANWCVAHRRRTSPLTTLFFEAASGEPRHELKELWDDSFVISGIQNVFAANAQNILNSFRFFGVYLCSSDCDFIYTIGNCGYTNESFDCGYCGENIGNQRGGGSHTLARRDKGARRLGPELGEGNYIGGDLNNNHTYWTNLGNDIKGHLTRIQQKKEIKMKVRGQMSTLSMTGYNRILKGEIDFLERIGKVTDVYQRLLLHALLLVAVQMQWVLPEQVKATIQYKEEDVVEYLAKTCFDLIGKLEGFIQLPDSIVWVLAISQKLKSFIAECEVDSSTYENREKFERMVDQAIGLSMRSRAKELINAHRKINDCEAVMAFDLILREDKLSPLYPYLKGFRINKIPTPDDLMVEYEAELSQQYPIIDICLKNVYQIQRISKLYDIIPFTNEIGRLCDFALTRERAKSVSIQDFIAEQAPEKQAHLRGMLKRFLQAWKFLSAGGPIQYECKTLGRMAPYDEQTPLIGFVVDTIEVGNEFGKILAGLIVMLSEAQNQILAGVLGRTRNLPRYKYVELFDENTFLPQSLKEGDLIRFDEEQLHKVIIEHSTNLLEYGNSVPVYDLRGIEDQLLAEIQGKKKFDTDISHLRNVRFVGETFANQGKFSSYILEIRRLGACLPLPPFDFASLLPAEKTAGYYALVKEILGSLERIMLAFKSLPEKGISLAEYVEKYKFEGVSKLLVEEAGLRDQDICAISAIYEFFEQCMSEVAWKSIPDEYGNPLEHAEVEQFKDLFTRLYEKIDDLPTFEDFKQCLNRFCMRCLSLGEFNTEEELSVWLCEKPDLWPHDYDQEKMYFLKVDMPPLKAKKVLSIHKLMLEFEATVPEALKNKMLELTKRSSLRLSNRSSSYIG